MHFCSLVLFFLASNRAIFYSLIALSPRIVCFLVVYFLSFEIIDWPFNFSITLRLCLHLERRFRYFFLRLFFMPCGRFPLGARLRTKSAAKYFSSLCAPCRLNGIHIPWLDVVALASFVVAGRNKLGWGVM